MTGSQRKDVDEQNHRCIQDELCSFDLQVPSVPTVLDTEALLMSKSHSASGQTIFIFCTTLCSKAMAG